MALSLRPVRAGVIARWALVLTLGLVLFSVMWVGAYRWIDPARQTSGAWLPLARIPVSLQSAVLLSEDARFCMHSGVDWISVNAALARARAGERLVGASTLSQQVAKNVFLWPARSWLRKGVEVWFTFLIENLWSKARILEVYLNEAQWGPEIYGVDAALKATGSGPQLQLDPFVATKLAVLLPSPVRYREKLPDALEQKRLNLFAMMMNPAIADTMRCIR